MRDRIGARRFFELEPSDWSMLLTGVVMAAMIILFI